MRGDAGDCNLHASEISSECRHCRAPLRTSALQKRGFCCHGCEGAYFLIASLGLNSFYSVRDRTGGNRGYQAIPDQGEARFGYLDDPNFQARYAALDESGLSRVVFVIAGIQCAACVWLLEKLPEVVSDIARVRVDLVRGRATVWFNPRTARLSSIARTFAGLGYTPRPVTADDATDRRGDDTLARQLGVAGFSAMNVMLLFVARYQGLFTGMEAQYAHFFAWASLLLALPAVVYSAQPFFASALLGFRMKRLHIDAPIAVAIVGGFAASVVNTLLGREEIYFDTVTALIFLLLVGRWFQRRAMKRVGDMSNLLYALTPLSALRETTMGNREEVFAPSIKPGDLVIVPSGEVVPCDGVIERGRSAVDNSFLTGESRPIPAAPGVEVWSGARNLESEIVVRAAAVGEASRLGKIVEGAQASAAAGGATARFVDRVSGYFVWTVLTISAVTFGVLLPHGFWSAWDRVMAFLVVTCPCALGIATPIVLHVASARAANLGILIRSGDALERLAEAKAVFFDKTGTVTFGQLSVVSTTLLAPEHELPILWSAIAGLERGLRHPAAEALYAEAERRSEFPLEVLGRSVDVGSGVRGMLPNGETVRVGSIEWLEREGIEMTAAVRLARERNLEAGLSTVAFSLGFDVVAVFGLGDRLRPEAQDVVRGMRERGIVPHLLSGDSPGIVARFAAVLGIENRAAQGALSPEAKAALVRRESKGVIFVGDGVNDAPALAAATVGIGISGGAEATLAVSDLFLLRPDLSLVVAAIDGARAARRLIRTHLAVSVFYNVTAGTLAVLGFMSPLAAAVVMPASSLSVIAASLRRAPFRGAAR